jgi:DNA primase
MRTKLIESCQFLLNNFYEASLCKDYLDNRLSEESQNLFNFGYFPPISSISALTSIIDKNDLINLKLLFSKKIEDQSSQRELLYSYFENYPIILPFKDTYGAVVGIVGRTLLSEEERKKKKIAKYKNTVFSKRNYLFGLYENKKEILDKNSVYIVEGQFDVIKAVENNMKNVVALSNSNMSDIQFSLIKRYTNTIFLLLDNDEAGEKGRQKILYKFGDYADIQNIYLPKEYKDIDEWFSENKGVMPTFTMKVKNI